MSFYYVKGISIKNDKVSFNLADSSLRPLYFHSVDSDELSDMLKNEGKKAVYSVIGKDVWNGNFHLYRGTKLCNLFLDAKAALPSELHWSNLDGKAAGEFLADAVIKLEKDRAADLSEDVSRLMALRNTKEYILEAAQRTGSNFLNAASEELQNDKEFAIEVIRAAEGSAHFDYPKAFTKDKEVALEALKLNGCFYRQLDDSLKADREIIFNAFAEAEGKTYHEHLPDLIPPWVFVRQLYLTDVLEKANKLHAEQDVKFMYGNWSWSLKKEGQIYKPFLYILEGNKLNEKGEPTNEMWARRYPSAEKAILHICNNLNENVAFKNFDTLEDAFKSGSVLDREFIYRLLDCCPSLHMDRAPLLLVDRDIALKWCQVGKWFPASVRYLPKKYAEKKMFQDVLLSRCDTDKSYTILKQKLSEMGVELYKEQSKPSLASQLEAAENKASAQPTNTIAPEKEFSV